MPTFKVKSPIKRDGKLYNPGDEIEVSKAEAKELGSALVIDAEATPDLAPRAPRTKAEKEAAAQAKKIAAAKEKANAEVDAELAAAGKTDDDKDADLDAPTVTNVERETTQEDLDNDPALVEQGVKVGDVREYPVTETGADDL